MPEPESTLADMESQIVCRSCGIRYSAEMVACPWCGKTRGDASPPEETQTPVAASETKAPGTAGLEGEELAEPPAGESAEAGPAPQDQQSDDPTNAGAAAAGTMDAEADTHPVEEAEQPTGSPLEPSSVVAAEVADTEETAGPQPLRAASANPPPLDEPGALEPPTDPDASPSKEAAARQGPPRTDAPPNEQAASADDASMPGRGDPSPGSSVPAGDTLVIPAPTETRRAPEPPESSSSRDLRRIMSWSPRWRRGVVTAATVIGLVVLGALLAEFAPLGPLAPGRSGSGETTVPGSRETSTTAASPTLTLEPQTFVPFIDPLGEPVAIAELRLGLEGIGPVAIGSDGLEAVGRLVSTLGQPDADTGVTNRASSWGACDGEEIRVVRWGSLAVINTVSRRGNETFAAYRLDLVYQQGAHPADDLRTLSGLSAGDTVADLQATYENFEVTLLDRWFELRRSSDGQLLLQGPLTSNDPDGVVRGIYSPDICDGG